MNDNFKELKTAREANCMDLSVWSFVAWSESKGCYIFKRKVRRSKV